jgi:hypothetical protein
MNYTHLLAIIISISSCSAGNIQTDETIVKPVTEKIIYLVSEEENEVKTQNEAEKKQSKEPIKSEPTVTLETTLNNPKTTILATEEEPIEKEETKTTSTRKTSNSISHNDFNTLLQKHVTVQGSVDYSNFKKEQQALVAYLTKLANTPAENNWSKNEQLAYWINLYNAATINLILDNYPVKSITSVHNGKPWDKKAIKSGNNTYSLNEIENEIIRPQFKEPRIHFAVNCAAVSCPKLLNEAFTPEKLEAQLSKQTKLFVNNTLKNNITPSKVTISKIFEWYRGDFEKNESLIQFLNKYSSISINLDAEVEFMEYDWLLNN